ncbi:MAG: signal peptidase I [Bifidobacteriaceae bacterium]|nr:signal peptidase I [Bifidobacteriaceae bacterium]
MPGFPAALDPPPRVAALVTADGAIAPAGAELTPTALTGEDQAVTPTAAPPAAGVEGLTASVEALESAALDDPAVPLSRAANRAAGRPAHQPPDGEDPPSGGSGSRRPPKKPEKRLVRFAKDAAFVVVAAVALSFLLKTFLIQSFYIPSVSMVPTLERLDRVLVTKLAPGVLDVHRGDVVVFENPGGWITSETPDAPTGGISGAFRSLAEAIGLAPADSKDFLIKRIIGLPGDRVACDGRGSPVTVNGVPLDETYVAPGSAPSEASFSVVVPPDAIWVMGDNRSQSADSRAHMDQPLGGAVALDDVVGVAQVRTWPLDRLALLRNPGRVFAAVPPADGGGS